MGTQYEFHPAASIFPLMDKDSLKALAADIAENHLEVPIELLDGKVIDGRNRYNACTMPGGPIDELNFIEVDVKDPIAYVLSLNLHRRHLTDSQRAMVSARALEYHAAEAKKRQREGQSKGGKTSGHGRKKDSSLVANLPPSNSHKARDDAAKQTSVSPRSVQHATTVLKKGSAKVTKAVEEGRLSVSKAATIVQDNPADKAAQDAAVAAIEVSKQANRVKGLTGEIEWYTPRMYLDSAAVVMNEIELDPASSKHAQKHVKAKRFYTIEDDGLQKEWSGRVFLNPPYRQPLMQNFVTKLCDEVSSGRVTQAILLTNGATDTEWFHQASALCTSVCLTRGRISFLQCKDGEIEEKTNSTCGQAFFYFGKQAKAFEKEFRRHGSIYQLVAEWESKDGR